MVLQFSQTAWAGRSLQTEGSGAGGDGDGDGEEKSGDGGHPQQTDSGSQATFSSSPRRCLDPGCCFRFFVDEDVMIVRRLLFFSFLFYTVDPVQRRTDQAPTACGTLMYS